METPYYLFLSLVTQTFSKHILNELREILANSDHDGVRLEKLALAQQLVADSKYPPADVLESVAKLLAKHLRPGGEG